MLSPNGRAESPETALETVSCAVEVAPDEYDPRPLEVCDAKPHARHETPIHAGGTESLDFWDFCGATSRALAPRRRLWSRLVMPMTG